MNFFDFLIFSVNVFVRISDIKLLRNKHIKVIQRGKNIGLATVTTKRQSSAFLCFLSKSFSFDSEKTTRIAH
jgi:hypothetical protein